MELLSIEETRIIYLINLHRPAGQLYWPEAALKLIQRYSFVGFPSIADFAKDAEFRAFTVGKYQDIEIPNLRIYNDGIIVESRSNSNICGVIPLTKVSSSSDSNCPFFGSYGSGNVA